MARDAWNDDTREAPVRRIGRYRLIAKLGHGGMGVVYDAIDESLHRSVAVKLIRPDASSLNARDRFLREARLAASVNHPHICQLYEIGESEGTMFLAMERLEGESLTARLERGAMPVDDVVVVGDQLLDALEALHARGIVHRDLKPSNIFLTPHGAKLLDFGLARTLADDTALGGLTASGTIVGTPRYMAPEQIAGAPVDARTDVFAAGAILYEMLAGRPAFDSDSLPAIMEQILHGDQPVLGGSPVVASLDRVIHRALAKTPAQRYARAIEMQSDLRAARRSSGIVETTRARPVSRLIVIPFRMLRADPDIEFLSFGLADAIANSLSPLQSLLVRSAASGARFAGGALDLKVVATEADVDLVVTGTLMRAGDRLRSTSQLLEAPGGTVLWSHTSDATIEDLFQLQDDLARRIVEALALPLSGRERGALGRDIPASAKAYEFYLRANQLSHARVTWHIARDLYLQAVEADPAYAPAWARLGRMHRVLAKYGEGDTERARAEAALNRALALNPDLTIADRYYADIDMERGRAQDAMARLVRRASRASDSELFAALVSVCRYCGLLEASLAAHQRATRLDPHVRTSIQYTMMALGRYLDAAAVGDPALDFGGFGLMMAGHPDAARRWRDTMIEPADPRMRRLPLAYLAVFEGTGSAAEVAAAHADAVAHGFRDPEGCYMTALILALGGDHDGSIEVLSGVVNEGYFPHQAFGRHRWLDPLRNRSDFAAIVAKAEALHRSARDAFIEVGGEALLGVDR